MSAVTDALFGGASRDAAGQQVDALNQAIATQQQAAAQARQDMYPRFDEAMAARRQGYQQAIDQISGAMPQQAAAIQQGNVAAQQQLLSGAQQAQAAILGGNIDYGALAPQQLTYDSDIFRTPDQPPTPNIGTPPPTPPTPTIPAPGGGTYTGPIDTAPIGGGDNFWETTPDNWIGGDGIYTPPIVVPDPGAPEVQPYKNIDQLVSNYLSGLGFGQTPGLINPPDPTIPPPKSPNGSDKGPGRQAPINVKDYQQMTQQSPDIYNIKSATGAKIYGGKSDEDILKKGESIRDFEARMNAKGMQINRDMFYQMFKDAGAF